MNAIGLEGRDAKGRFANGHKITEGIPLGELNRNFCAHYLGLLRQEGNFEKITDTIVDIDSIKVFKPAKLIYFRPRLIYDNYFDNNILAEPDIKVTRNMQELADLNFVICSIPTRVKWFPKQKNKYVLVKEEFSSKKHIVNGMPSYHFIEYDRANRLIRLVGENTSPQGVGEWMKI